MFRYKLLEALPNLPYVTEPSSCTAEPSLISVPLCSANLPPTIALLNTYCPPVFSVPPFISINPLLPLLKLVEAIIVPSATLAFT